MKTRKKKEKQRALHRKAKELVKSAPRFLTRDKETSFNREIEHKDAMEVMRWLNTM